MIETHTTLILGAGASMPYGFPSGPELVKQITSGLSILPDSNGAFKPNNEKFYSVLSILYHKEFIEEFRMALIMSQINSIDEFLSKNKKYIDIGKCCIIYLIREKESSVIFYTVQDNWYKKLWNSLVSNTRNIEDFKKNKLSVITYNYDRSIEYYLFNCIQYSFDLSQSEAYNIFIETFKIIHIHGVAGELFRLDNNIFVELHFEKPFEHIDITSMAILKNLSNHIKIIHDDNINESTELKEANEILTSTERICFLGFGYAEDNLKRLKINNYGKLKTICGSAYGLTDLEINRIALKHAYFRLPMSSSKIYLYNVNAKCDEFLSHHFIL